MKYKVVFYDGIEIKPLADFDNYDDAVRFLTKHMANYYGYQEYSEMVKDDYNFGVYVKEALAKKIGVVVINNENDMRTCHQIWEIEN